MKVTLRDYQQKAANEVLKYLRAGAAGFNQFEIRAAVALSAVTGAGKTVIAASVLETLLHGAPDIEPEPDTTILWLTDDPSLNRQTSQKMRETSDLDDELITIDDSLDQEVLDPGKIHFLNIQKLSATSNLTRRADRRRYTIWETLANTIKTRRGNFLLILDEAHRGTGANSGLQTIVRSFLEGDPEKGLPPVPIVLGISATIDNFVKTVKQSIPNPFPVEVDVNDVRASGMIKDLLRISIPDGAQLAPMTLVEQAVEDVLEFEQRWAEHSEETGDPLVKPALVIQVPHKVSHKDLAALLDVLHKRWVGLPQEAVVHCFQEHKTLNLPGHEVQYAAPESIQNHPHARVVLFKDALTTGWDCPRAEVMVSLRTAKDKTHIAQLIGRMVRTPLAKRVSTRDTLNTVSLHLPRFNKKSLDQVLGELKGSGTQPVTSIVVCERNPSLHDDVWKAVARVPTYTRPKPGKSDQVALLIALANELDVHGIAVGEPDRAKQIVVEAMKQQARSIGDEALSKLTDALGRHNVQLHQVETFGNITASTQRAHRLHPEDIATLYATASRRLGDGAATWYWRSLLQDPDRMLEPAEARLLVAALASDESAIEAIHGSALQHAQRLLKQHEQQIGDLPPSHRDAIYAIFEAAPEPTEVKPKLPTDIVLTFVRDDGTNGLPAGVEFYPKHLYTNEAELFPTHLNDWEKEVLRKFLPNSVAWYRNPTAGKRAIGVPYTHNGPRTLYPDFLFVRQTQHGYVVDIVDPHAARMDDTRPKWIGLAEYARKHDKALGGRVYAVMEVNARLFQVDLTRSDVRTELNNSSVTLADLFLGKGKPL